MNIRRLRSGIPGFDNLVEGGFYPGSLNMISGGPGAGKTIFALQFIYYGAMSYGERGLYISFEESREDLIEDARRFGWDFEELERLGRAKIIFHSPYDLKKFSSNLLDEIEEFKASRVVFDSASVLGLAMDNQYQVRRFLFDLATVIRKTGATGIITSESAESYSLSGDNSTLSRYGVEEFICDSVTTLHYGGFGGDSDRMIRVLKMRRTKQVRDLITMDITDKGIIVTPPANLVSQQPVLLPQPQLQQQPQQYSQPQLQQQPQQPAFVSGYEMPEYGAEESESEI